MTPECDRRFFIGQHGGDQTGGPFAQHRDGDDSKLQFSEFHLVFQIRHRFRAERAVGVDNGVDRRRSSFADAEPEGVVSN